MSDAHAQLSGVWSPTRPSVIFLGLVSGGCLGINLDSLLLVAGMLLVVRPGAPSSVLAPSSDARSP